MGASRRETTAVWNNLDEYNLEEYILGASTRETSVVWNNLDEYNLDDYIEDMDHKSRRVRIGAFASLVNAFTLKPLPKFAESNIVTLVYHCLGCIRKYIGIVGTTKKISTGATREIALALRILALIALNVDDIDLAQEVYKDAIPVLAEYLDRICAQDNTSTYNLDPLLVSELIDCLGMVGFFAPTDPKEIEKVMVMLWEFLLSIEVGKRSDSSCDHDNNCDLLVATIRAWSFLLSFVPADNISFKHWKGCLDYFCNLLDHHDDYYARVLTTSVEALNLILEIDVLDKFSHQGYSSDLSCTLGQSIREKIKGTMHYLKDVDSGSFGMLIQMRMMERFLGDDGFTNHIKNNNKLQMLFETMLRRNSNNLGNLNCPPPPERARLVVKFFERLYLKDVRDAKLKKKFCEKTKSKNSSPSPSMSKARTQLLKKQRWHVYAQFYHYYSDY